MQFIKSPGILLSIFAKRHVKKIESVQRQRNAVTMGGCGKLFKEIHSYVSGLAGDEANQQITVLVEGNIGSGKTALLEYFSHLPIVEVFQEPTAKWRAVNGHNVLALMYTDPARWSLTFQTYVQLTMLQSHLQAQTKPVKMMERSIFSAKYCFVENLHKSNKMADIEYAVLSKWFDWILTTHHINVDLIVYLQTRPEVVHERIKRRCSETGGRAEESCIALEYLQQLHTLHEDWLINARFPLPAPVLVLDANDNLTEMNAKFETQQSRILCRARL